jgi:hypothetical protein
LDVKKKVAIGITFTNLKLLFNKDFDKVKSTSGGNVPFDLRRDGNVNKACLPEHDPLKEFELDLPYMAR